MTPARSNSAWRPRTASRRWRTFERQRACGLAQRGQSPLLFSERVIVALELAERRAGAPQVFLEHDETSHGRLQLAARGVERGQLLLRVRHLYREAVAQHIEALELRAPRQLVAQPPIDVGAQAC